MNKPETESSDPLLDEAVRELEATAHDARVAFDCVALGELDRATPARSPPGRLPTPR